MLVTTVWQSVVSRLPGVWTAEEVTPVVSFAFMEGVSPYRYSKCANLRIPRMVLKRKCAKIKPRENKPIHRINNYIAIQLNIIYQTLGDISMVVL